MLEMAPPFRRIVRLGVDHSCGFWGSSKNESNRLNCGDGPGKIRVNAPWPQQARNSVATEIIGSALTNFAQDQSRATTLAGGDQLPQAKGGRGIDKRHLGKAQNQRPVGIARLVIEIPQQGRGSEEKRSLHFIDLDIRR